MILGGMNIGGIAGRQSQIELDLQAANMNGNMNDMYHG